MVRGALSPFSFRGRFFRPRSLSLSGSSVRVQRIYKTFIMFCKFFESFLLQILWIYRFWGFTSYPASWLYYGCMDFSHFLQSKVTTQSQLRRFEFSKQSLYLFCIKSGSGTVIDSKPGARETQKGYTSSANQFWAYFERSRK